MFRKAISFLSMFPGSVEYSGCRYKSGEEITDKRAKWEAERKDTERKRKNEEEEYVYKDSLTDLRR